MHNFVEWENKQSQTIHAMKNCIYHNSTKFNDVTEDTDRPFETSTQYDQKRCIGGNC